LSHQRRGPQILFELLLSLREGKALAVMTSVVVMALVAPSIPAQAKGKSVRLRCVGGYWVDHLPKADDDLQVHA
jgi:hypothetical protein